MKHADKQPLWYEDISEREQRITEIHHVRSNTAYNFEFGYEFKLLLLVFLMKNY